MFKSLKDILPGTIEELGISEQLMRAAVFAAWRALAAELPAHARAVRATRFHHGTLVAEAPSSAAVHELHMRTPQLTRDLNTRLGRPLVSKLEFRVHGRRPTNHAATGTAPEAAGKTPTQPATTSDDPERDKRLRQAIDLIEDPVVRQQALNKLARTQEQTDRCTLCGVPVGSPGLCPLCQAAEGQESAE